jgi:RNA polymerase sigma-70 factor (TIGR02960 family)
MTSTTEDLQQLDETAFGARVERHRRELHVHCYRMLGSFEESEDLVQETFLRAWRRRETYAGRASVRAWLHRIATNACLDALDKRPRTPTADGEVLWLQPYPDALLEELPDGREGPEDVTLAKETLELAFLIAIQHLAPLPRAVLVLRDVLGCSARETASLLETTEASVNSALQRARAGLRERLPERRAEWAPGADPTAAERELLDRYVELSERADAQGLAALLHEDVRFTMPPQPGTWVGRDRVVGSWVEGGFGEGMFGSMRCVVTRANGQPAVACYVRRPGDDAYTPLAIDVLRIEEGAVKDITTFDGALRGMFDLPPRL